MNEKGCKIIGLVRSVLGDEITGDTSMLNFPKWDSLKTLQIVMALDESGFSIPLEKIPDIKSVQDILSLAVPRGVFRGGAQ